MLSVSVVIVLLVAHSILEMGKKSYEIGKCLHLNPSVTPVFSNLTVLYKLVVFLNDSLAAFAFTQITQNTHEIQTFTSVCGRAFAPAIRKRSEFRRC